MLANLLILHRILKNQIRHLKSKHANSLMSAYLQLELPFTMATETGYRPLRSAQLTRAAKTRKAKTGK